jgi:hypothetical protein
LSAVIIRGQNQQPASDRYEADYRISACLGKTIMPKLASPCEMGYTKEREVLGELLWRLVMKSHIVPFENRWTNGERAWRWHCELERLGVSNVRMMFSEHETHHGDEPAVVFDVPAGFVRDWLAFHDWRTARQQRLWRAMVIGLGLVAVSGVMLGT